VPDPTPDDPLEAVWGRAREELRASVPASTFRLWLEPLAPASAEGRTLYLSAPRTIRSWVERRYVDRIVGVLHELEAPFDRVSLVDRERLTGEAPQGRPALSEQPLDPSHTFEAFVIGPGNRLAHAASLAVAELPGEAYNPLFLHGPPGLGKTHLLGAVVDYLRRNHPHLTVHCTTAERFTAEFVSALRSDGPERFKVRYRELDALLIDDVQVLEGKQRTEEEFVHTFNALYAAGKQIVLSSDRPPSALAQLEQRLRDRFQWGLTVALEPPDLRTRMALLWRMAARSSPDLADPLVLREIAGRVPGNVRALEGAMTRVIAVASMLSEPITEPVVARALSYEQKRESSGAAGPSVAEIQDAVATTLNLSREELLSPRRTPRIARARQLAMYLTRELTPLSLAQIARQFDRDHSTVLHAIRSVSQRREPGSETESTIERVRASLGRTDNPDSLNPPDPGKPTPPQD
jgi:chromosomal replication initiator protein